jgi:creatine kinase
VVGFPFPTQMNRISRRQIERILQDCSTDWQPPNSNNNNTSSSSSSSSNTTSTITTMNGGKYRSIMDMNNIQHEELIRRYILFPNPDDFLSLAGFGNDWPDGRGLYCNDWDKINIGETPNIMIWCNAYDHYWIISHAKGGNVQEVFTQLSNAIHTFETSLQQRGYHFVEDPELGFLNSSPADIGTALRASVSIKLFRLGQLPGFYDVLCKKLHLQARQQLHESDKQQLHNNNYYYNHFATTRGSRSSTTESSSTDYNNSNNRNSNRQGSARYTGIFQIANAESYGQSEVELINIMIIGVAKCIELEKRLENGEIIDLNTIDI